MAASLALALALVLAGCADDPEAPEDPDPPDVDEQDSAAPQDGDGTEPAAVEPLSGDPTTADREEEGEPGRLAVTDVEVAQHDSFDRVVFHIEGEGTPGWFLRYEDEAISDPSDEPLDVAGGTFLRVAIRNVALPPDLPEALEERVWDAERVTTPDDAGVIREVVGDGIFEGQHGFVLGIDRMRPYLVERVEEGDGEYRVVLDVFDEEPDPDALAGDPTTAPREQAGEPDTQFVHDVRVGGHDGFDRVVVEHSGAATVGWRTAYSDDSRAREALGVEEPGEVVLEITIRDITPPDELDEQLQTWDEGPIDGPAGGVIEGVDTAIAGTDHVIVVGLSQELPYLVEYVDDPPGTLILDIFHP